MTPRAGRSAFFQVMRVLVDKATGKPRHALGQATLLRAIRDKKHVALPEASLPLSAPLATLGEHALPLRFDARHIAGQHTLTVLVKKKL